MPITIDDPMQVPTYRGFGLQKTFESWLYDPRDVVFLVLTLKVLALMVPLLVAMCVHFHWALMVTYLVLWLWYVSPVILMLHNTMHRPFIRGSRWVNRAHALVLSMLFGIPTGYMEHHVGMHHVENNVGEDLSATWRYERDNFLHWLHYFARFLFLITLELPSYLRRKKRKAMARAALIGAVLEITIGIGFFMLDWRIGVFAFALPWFLCRFAMMIGNWGQHAFIDPARPADSLVNSITCINSGYNKRCFNDGYHIGHHVKPNRHWADMPRDFLESQAEYAKAGSIVFTGIDFFVVSVLLFARRYDILANRFVSLDGKERTQAEIIEFLKSRTRPIGEALPTTVVNAAA